MTIETGIENAGVYIDALDDTYPASGDDLVEGDNHIRGIKNTLLNTFPNITGAVTATHTELNKTKINTTENNQRIDASGTTESQAFYFGASGLDTQSSIIFETDSGTMFIGNRGSAASEAGKLWIVNEGNDDVSIRTSSPSSPRAIIRHAGGVTVPDDAPATPTANTLYADSMVKAWGMITFSGSTPTLDDDVNLTITDIGVGITRLNFATSMGSTTYFAGITPHTIALYSTNVSKTTTTATVTIRDNALSAADVNFDAIIVGQQ